MTKELDIPKELKGTFSRFMRRIPAKLRNGEAVRKTTRSRFDWFSYASPTDDEAQQAFESIPPHYVVHMHTEVIVDQGRVGETSVTSLDVHDIARASATYGVKNVFVVTPLLDQQKILNKFLGFWHSDEGKKYNESRYNAVERVAPTKTLKEAISYIKEREEQEPLLIATSARQMGHPGALGYRDQGKVWCHDRPVVLIFGSGRGLSDDLIASCDYLLDPVYGMVSYNHLSVRSAVAITLDRWLGVHSRRGRRGSDAADMVDKCGD